MTDQQPAHAFLAPSDAERWGPGGCPASAHHQAKYPQDEESPDARDGTAAHWVLSEQLYGRPPVAGSTDPDGTPITQEMIDCTYDIVRDIQDTMRTIADPVLHVEERVFMTNLVNEHNWGTPDDWLVNFPAKIVHLWDYKFGHRYVDAYKCWQMIDYAIGVMTAIGVPAADWDSWTITMTIAQPRNYHPDGPLRQWDIGGAQLRNFAVDLQLAAADAIKPDAPFKTGNHCRDCTGRHACPALQKVAMAMVDISLTAQPVDMPPEALGLELKIIRAAIKRLGDRATGLEAQALGLIRGGANVPLWKGEYSSGREKFVGDIDQIFTLGDIFEIDLRKPPAAITPHQARKAGMPEDVIKPFTDTPRGSLALVPVDNDDIAKRFS